MTDMENWRAAALHEPVCPYCGEKMKLIVYPDGEVKVFNDVQPIGFYNAFYSCVCGACTTRVMSLDRKIAEKGALEHALRRPMQKPMTHDELLKHLSTMHPNEIAPLYIEFRGEYEYDLDFAVRWRDAYNLSTINAGHGERYGKTWRCWRARPNNEELEAAKWEEEHGE